MFAYGEAITVTRQGAPTGALDELGNPIPGAPTTFTVVDVGVAPITPDEAAEVFGDRNVGGFTLYLPPDADLLTSDLITVRGSAGFHVQGDAYLVEWRSPFTGWNPGQVAIVRRSS